MHDSHPDTKTAGGDPLFDLVRGGDAAGLEAAIAAGAAADSRNAAGDSLLMLAAYHGHADCVALLLAHRADPNALNDKGQHPLAGVSYKGDTATARALLEGGADAEGARSASRSPLMYAAMYNHRALTRLLLEHGADPARVDRDGKTALTLAREMRAVHTIGLLEEPAGDG